jgi:hypothetical protein
MIHSTPRRLSSSSISFLLGTVALVFSSFGASAQVYTRTQDFNAGTAPSSPPVNSTITTTTLSFGVTSVTNTNKAGYYSTAGIAGGPGAYGVEDPNNSLQPNTLVLDFAPQVFQKNSTSNQITFQLGSKGGPNQGFEAANEVRVSISINGATPQLILTLSGPQTRNSGPNFDLGTGGTATANFPVANSTAMTSTAPIGNLTVNLPIFADRTTVGLQIAIVASQQAVNIIDNVKISSGSPLPVELTRFDATAKGTGVNLTWATATEKNNDRFEVQRSATGDAYTTIGTVKGQGSTTMAHDYNFLDSHALAGTSYYRLRQVDTDGTFSFSPVVAVQTEASTKAMLYPNPSANQLILPAGVGVVQYRIFNSLGQTLLSGQATDNDRLDITSLPKGPFFLELSGATGHYTQRLMRQ